MLSNALIGYTGFVGGNILRQSGDTFGQLFNSKNIADIRGQTYDLVVCAGITAEMWTANQAPAQDLTKIQQLLDQLATIQAKQFVFISTVDVFAQPNGVNEDTMIDPNSASVYGRNRFMAEQFIRQHFPHHVIMRLAGLFGEGMKKNLIYDLMNGNNPNAFTNPASVFQFYDISRLWSDIQIALQHNLAFVHCTAEPINARVVAKAVFDVELTGNPAKPARIYDFQTKYAALFGGRGMYFYDTAATIQRIKAFVHR